MSKYSTLLIEYDALFDTRLALINSYGEEALSKILNNDYFTRTMDKFPTIDYNEFQLKYSQRNKSLLADAIITPIVYMVSDFVYSTMVNAINGPDPLEPRIIVNTYPYVCSNEENTVVKEQLVEITNGNAVIEFIFKSPLEIRPAYLRDNVELMIMYDYVSWIEAHSKTDVFKRITIPDVTLIGPKISFIEPNASILHLLKKDNIDPFKVLQEKIAPIINLKLLPIHMFSLNIVPEAVAE
jgi:hypothetical protein